MHRLLVTHLRAKYPSMVLPLLYNEIFEAKSPIPIPTQPMPTQVPNPAAPVSEMIPPTHPCVVTSSPTITREPAADISHPGPAISPVSETGILDKSGIDSSDSDPLPVLPESPVSPLSPNVIPRETVQFGDLPSIEQDENQFYTGNLEPGYPGIPNLEINPHQLNITAPISNSDSDYSSGGSRFNTFSGSNSSDSDSGTTR